MTSSLVDVLHRATLKIVDRGKRNVRGTSKTTSVRLGDMAQAMELRVRSGSYASVSEVKRAALRALDREERALDDVMRQKVKAALDDPRPSIPADKVFAELRAEHEKRAEAAKRDA